MFCKEGTIPWDALIYITGEVRQIHATDAFTDRSFSYASPRLWNQLPDSFRQPHHSCLDSLPHALVNPSLSSSLLSSAITPSLFHSRPKTYLFNKSFPPTGLPRDNGTAPGAPDLSRSSQSSLIILFLVSHFIFLFISCGRLSWLPSAFYCMLNTHYRIVSHMK